MTTPDDKVSIAVRETAAEWVVRLGAPEISQADKAAFAAWLRASPIHVKEYLRAEAAWFAVRNVAQNRADDVQQLLQAADTNVVELALNRSSRRSAQIEAVQQRDTRRSAGPSRGVPMTIAAALLLTVGAMFTLLLSDRFDRNSYSTAVGEMRRVVLADGSAVELNTHSKIRVDFGEHSRDIYLRRGEAFFSVAKDSRRPFRVFSDAALIRAVGTQFSVYRKPDQTVVTVVEGKVAVSPQNLADRLVHTTPSTDAAPSHEQIEDDANALELTAGHQVVIDTRSDAFSSDTKAANVDTARATAWRQDRLIFDNDSLIEVVAEFNRYNRQKLMVEDPELATLAISGVFDPDKPQGLLGFLVTNGDVQVTELSSSRILLTPPER